MNKTMLVERTKKGFPALWESGGGWSNTGQATIIADKDGQPKKAIYIRRRGQLANCRHALIPIAVGDYVISADHHREDFEILVYRMTRISKEEVYMEKVAEFSDGEWNNLPQFLEEAVEAAIEKATCYHCREPHFAKEPALPHNNH